MKRAQTAKLVLILPVLAAVGVWYTPTLTVAATPTWIGPNGNGASGNWNTNGNWNPASVPGTGDDVTIAPSNGNMVTVTYDYTGAAVTLSSLTLAADSSSSGNLTLSMSGNNLTAHNEFVADGAPSDSHTTAATFDQSDGTNSLPSGSNSGNLYLGHDTSDTGTYKLSGTAALSVGFTEYVGYDGVGIFNQSGGTNTTAHLDVGFGHSGDPTSSMGSYSLSNGSLMVNGEESVSLNVNGTFTQSGGTNTSTELAIGRNQLAKTGMFTLSGGSVSTATEYVGSQEGTGTLTQSGSSTNTITTALNVAADLGTENGTYNLNGGGLTAPLEYIGCNVATGIQGAMFQGGGVGAVIQTAGTNTVISGEVYIGASTDISSSRGSYSIDGSGVLTVNSAYGIHIGTAGTLDINGGTINTSALTHDSGSTFSWTGGTLNITNSIAWDPSANPSSSTGNLFGSSLTLGPNLILGVTGDETLGGSGNFTLTAASGGANNVGGTLTVYPGSKLILSGGSITTNVLDLGNTPSRFSWTTGTLNFTNGVTFDPGGSSTTNAFGSSLNLSSNKTLSVTGNETVGNNGFFNLVVSSGGANNVSGTLTVNPLSEMDINGGTVTAGSLHNIGPLNINSGTLTAGSVMLDASGSLDIGLGGTTRGTQYGALIATGNAALAGPLTVTLDSFTPTAGQSFDILDWGTRSGKFGSVNLPSLPSGLVWSTLELYSQGELIVANSTLLPGDFNRDGHVDTRDIVPMMQALTNLSAYQASHGNIPASQVKLIGDVNSDGQFNDADLQALLDGLKAGGGSTTSVPEPNTFVLAAVAFSILCWQFRFCLDPEQQRPAPAVPSTR